MLPMPGGAAIFAACSRQSVLMPMILDAICSETPLFTLSSLIYSHMIWPEPYKYEIIITGNCQFSQEGQANFDWLVNCKTKCSLTCT